MKWPCHPSPTDRTADGLQDFIANGARLGWLGDALKQQVPVLRPESPVERPDRPQSVSAEPLLPGFSLEVSEIRSLHGPVRSNVPAIEQVESLAAFASAHGCWCNRASVLTTVDRVGIMSKLHEALDRFDALFNRAAACNLNEPAAVTVATVDADGRPSARVVLLKGYDASGFVFYTNIQSRKGHELAANPRVAMCFFWDPLMEQVRVEGHVSPVTDAQADAYWNGRHPGSRIGAWASDQSEPLASRETLETRVAEFAGRFGGGPIPRPPHWSGYRVVPTRVEFWHSLPNRLHERTCYSLEGGEWRVSLLYP